MKKTFTKLLTLLLAVVLCLSAFAGCGQDSDIDESKIQVYVYTVSDGYGHQYMDKLVTDWNNAHPDSEYQFVWTFGTEGFAHIPTQLETDTCTNKNIWVGSNSEIINYIANDYVIDISDVYEMEVDGVKIKDKVMNYDAIKDGYSDYFGNGMYAIPHGYSISPNMVFDFTHFLREGYLNYAKESEMSAINAQVADAVEVKAGNTLDNTKYKRVNENVLVAKKAFGNYEVGEVVLTAGRDGEYGTYDDGQVQYVSEFYELLKKIVSTGGDNAFIYTTQFARSNTPQIYMSMLYHNMGYENAKVFDSFNGTFQTNLAGDTIQITMDNANTMWETDVVRNAITEASEFFDKAVLGRLEGMANVSKYLSRRTWSSGTTTTSLSHTDAQACFSLDHVDRGNEGYKECAFLLEGTWWENESQEVLAELGGYGADAVECRYYLNPILENQVGAEDITVLDGSTGSNVMLYLNNYPDEVETDEQKAAYDDICKQFIAYTCSDEALNWYTKRHGIKAGFNYELTADTLESITPFQRNAFEMLSDTEHIKIIDSTVTGGNKNIVRQVSEIYDYYSRSASGSLYHIYDALSGASPLVATSDYYACVNRYIQSDYASKLASAKQYISELG